MAKRKPTKNRKSSRGLTVKKLSNGMLMPEEPVAKEAFLFDLYLKQDGKHSERMKGLLDSTGLSKSGLYLIAGKHNWQERADMFKATQEQEQAVTALMTQHNTIVSGERVSFEGLADDIKQYASLAVRATKSTVFVSVNMLMYWNSRITQVVEAKGGYENLSETDTIRIKVFEDKVQYYYNSVKEFIRPSAVVNYLRLLNMSEALQVTRDDNELGTLTPAGLCKLIEQMGIGNALGDSNLADVVEAEIIDMGVDIPDMDGTKL